MATRIGTTAENGELRAPDRAEISLMVRGPATVNGGPNEAKVEFILSWWEVLDTVRSGQFPTRIVDAFIAEAMTIGSSREALRHAQV